MYMNILCRKFSKNPTKLFSPHIVTGINIKKIISCKTAATARQFLNIRSTINIGDSAATS